MAWARHAAALSDGVAKALLARGRKRPTAARAAHRRIIDLRECTYRIFAAIAHGTKPAAGDLALLHQARVQAIGAAELRWDREDGGTLEWAADGADLLRPAYPAILAAVDLLGKAREGRLRQCGNDPCGWLFLDTSRSGTRRWCSSAECGNATRVRRFRAKK